MKSNFPIGRGVEVVLNEFRLRAMAKYLILVKAIWPHLGLEQEIYQISLGPSSKSKLA